MYKIEGRDKYGIWDDSNVGGNPEYNQFETREEAAQMLPVLAMDLDCDINNLRVLETGNCDG
jgi:hypothetical protein